jgi:hypothetical protein
VARPVHYPYPLPADGPPRDVVRPLVRGDRRRLSAETDHGQ